MIQLSIGVLAYPFMAAAALLGTFMCFVAFFDMHQASHKRLLGSLCITFFLMVVGFSLASLVAMPGANYKASDIIPYARPVWFVCSVFFFYAVLGMYWHIEAVRHQQ
jgi:glucose uptake protein GlcU